MDHHPMIGVVIALDEEKRRHCRPNRLFRVESVKNSSWYRNFTAPGVTRVLTHELSSSDRFGKFHHYFCMPLSKVEALTDTLITCGYVWFSRSRCCQAKFSKRTVMSSLNLLGTGAAFRSCRLLCSISTSEVRKIFYVFLDAIVDMKDEYIYMPQNITEFNRVSSCYGVAGLPGCCGSVAAKLKVTAYSILASNKISNLCIFKYTYVYSNIHGHFVDDYRIWTPFDSRPVNSKLWISANP